LIKHVNQHQTRAHKRKTEPEPEIRASSIKKERAEAKAPVKKMPVSKPATAIKIHKCNQCSKICRNKKSLETTKNLRTILQSGHVRILKS